MPYIRNEDFAQIVELIDTIKELAAKEKYSSIPAIATNMLRVIEKYIRQ